MKKVTVRPTHRIKVNASYEAEPLEWILEKATTQKTPIEATSPQIFTERKDGVRPEYDIRTDRFEIAENAMDKVTKEKIAKREGQHKTDALPETGETLQSD